MRSAEVAHAAGVNPQTLRYYQRRGLLAEPDRLDSGYRSWDDTAVRTVRFVKHAQQLGFSLEEIASLLELAGGGPDSCETARQLAVEKTAQLDAKIAALTAMRDALVRLADTCSRPRARRHCPLVQAIDTDHPVKDDHHD